MFSGYRSGRFFNKFLESFHAVAGADYLVCPGAYNGLNQVQVIGIIIDTQDLHDAFRAGPRIFG